MGLDEIVNISEQSRPGPTGELETVFEVSFTTEQTSGLKTVTVPADEFSGDVARQRARERAEEIDAAFQPPSEEE